MSITWNISVIHSCPEDQSSIWINMKHSVVPEIPRECFPGVSGRSWTVALTAVRLCSQPRWSRCTPPSSPSTRCSPMRISATLSSNWRAENGTFLACVLLGAGHTLSFLATRWDTALSELTGVWDQFMEGKARLYGCTEKDVGDVPLFS